MAGETGLPHFLAWSSITRSIRSVQRLEVCVCVCVCVCVRESVCVWFIAVSAAKLRATASKVHAQFPETHSQTFYHMVGESLRMRFGKPTAIHGYLTLVCLEGKTI